MDTLLWYWAISWDYVAQMLPWHAVGRPCIFSLCGLGEKNG